jgi:predicted regulator of Ras-like GTPase activity (Roadblock/LC7/MglB family)
VTAAERVPASTGGTSVPTSSQSAAPLTATPPAPAAPTRIPFKLTPPPEDGAVKGEPWLTKENFAAASEAAPLQAATPARVPAKVTQKISLPLKPILEALPPFQLTGDVKSVSNATRIELPFALVESQLASGRVHLTPEDFAAALPEEHRSLFTAKDIATPVMLPLQDVLQNLPGAALRMRDDQEEQERGSNFATPFSATAEEDARRFNVASEPVAKPAFSLATPVAQIEVAPPPAVVVAPATPPAEAPEPEPAPARVLKLPRAKLPTRKERTPLQKALDTDESVEPKAVVTHIQKMDGVEGCAIMFGDGLNLAGELPEAYEADGLCAMAPSLVQRIENHMVETKLGALSGMTLSCTEASISFFMHDNLCLAAVHKEGSLGRDVRARLDAIVQELSKTYSQPA